MIILDKALSRKGDIKDELTIDPIVVQDSETGQDTLSFACPVESIIALGLTWRAVGEMTWNELIDYLGGVV